MSKPIAIPIENYKKLACAILERTTLDYVDGLLSEEYFSHFLYDTVWVQCLDLNKDYLFEKAKEKRDEEDERKARQLAERKAKRLMERRRSKGLD